MPPCFALGLPLAALCVLLGSSGLVAAEKPDPAETLRQLRKPVHEWIERDIGEKTRAENRASADLVQAFGLARAGDADRAKKLLREATAVLEEGDAAHRCLLGLYRHRIDQVLAGKPPVGPLTAKLLADVTPTGNEPVNASIKLHHYIVLRAREFSRVIDPLEQVDPYLPWTAKGFDDPLVARLGPLQDEQDPERFAKDTLARDMHESGDFSAMPILADALQDAGCDNDDILNHSRESGVYVRGCWVVGLVQGKV